MKRRLFIPALLALLALLFSGMTGIFTAANVSANGFCPGNLLTNGDFSDNLTGWNETWDGFGGAPWPTSYPNYPATAVNGYLDLGVYGGYHYVSTDYIPVCSANLTFSCLFRPVSWATSSGNPIGIVAVIVYLYDETTYLGSLWYYFSPSHNLSSTSTEYYAKLGTGVPIPPGYTAININILDVLNTNLPAVDTDAITRVRVRTYTYGTEVDATYTVGYFDDFCLTYSSGTGTINIIKEVVGEAPGLDWAFTGDLNNFNIAPGGGYHTSDNLTPGTYTITETPRLGYATSVSCSNCDNCTYTDGGVTIDLGLCDNVTCTFTNTVLPGATVNIIKEVVGEAPTDNWTFFGGTGEFEFLPSGGTYIHEDVIPQKYLYREVTKDGYALSVNCTDCQDWYPYMGSFDNGVVVEVGPGDNATCTFTNTQTGIINIIKEVLGEVPVSDWEFTGDLNFNIAPGGGYYTSDNFTPGTYYITETLKDGYTTSVSCDNCNNCTCTEDGVAIEIGSGDNVTCTFVNSQTATVNIIKEVVGEAPPDNWTFSGSVSFELSPSGGTYTHEDLSPQTTYLYREDIKDGYALSVNCTDCQDWYPWMGSFDNGVVVDVGPGDNATCTFTNTAQPGTINIIKELMGEAPGSDWAFTGDLNFNIAPGGGYHTSDNLTPSTYNIAETPKDGYTASVSCDNCTNCTYADGGVTIDLGPGDNVTCTFINTAEAQPPTPTPPDIFPPAQRPRASWSSPPSGVCCQPQALHVQFLRITPQQADVGEPLTILASVTNDCIETCTYDVTLAINNKVEQTKSISIGPSSAYPVEFTVIKHEPGKYNVIVSGQRANFTILGTGDKTSGSAPTGTPIAIIIITVLSLMVLATGIILVRNYRRNF